MGDAILCARDWARDKPTAVLYPDESHPPKGSLMQLRREHETSPGCWLGLTANKQKRRQGILAIEEIDENVFYVNEFSKRK